MQVAIEVSYKAGEILLGRFYQAKETSMKGSNDFVTNVDKESEAFIMAELAREFPDMGLLGEESAGARPDEGYVWVVDPVYGARNYAWRIPFVSLVVRLALDGEALVGVNYDPICNEMFHSERGKVVFLNDDPTHVSDRPNLSKSVVGFDLSYAGDDGASNRLQVIQAMLNDVGSTRIMGSAALGISYAAAGRYSIYFNHRLEPWDRQAYS